MSIEIIMCVCDGEREMWIIKLKQGSKQASSDGGGGG
jgi:hypothetical protein